MAALGTRYGKPSPTGPIYNKDGKITFKTTEYEQII